jgi:aminomethyltransferase
MSNSLKRSHIYDYNIKYAKMTNFAGFSMPIWYKGIIEEHLAVRNDAGLFDVSHMGRIVVSGKEAFALIDKLVPTTLEKAKVGRSFYSALLNEKGGIIDDIIVMRLEESKFLLVVNASNRSKDLEWIGKLSSEYDVKIDDVSEQIGLIAIQGPKSSQILQSLTPANIESIGRFSFFEAKVDGSECLLSRTGYTGEDGFEIFVLNSSVQRPERTLKIWKSLLDCGRDRGVLPCGLGARDTLRLEAGLCLYGNDIDESTTPIEADLKWIISMEKPNFEGKSALERQEKEGIRRKRVGFVLKQGIPRHGYPILSNENGSLSGVVTSGTFSPLLRKGIGMGYVPTEIANPGSKILIDTSGKKNDGEITRMPFYDTSKYGWRRLRSN